jgi:probable phosphoglycerate mutase
MLTAQKRYSGRGDVALSETGRVQAQAVAARVAALGPVAVVSSPLSRCTETAALIGVQVTTEADLIECDFGEWEGLTFAEVRQRYASELNAWLGSTAIAAPGGESFRQVAARVRRALDRMRKAYPGQTVAVVSHVSPIKLILRDALAASDALLHRLFLDPAGLSIVDYFKDGGVAVRTVNDVAHLA